MKNDADQDHDAHLMLRKRLIRVAVDHYFGDQCDARVVMIFQRAGMLKDVPVHPSVPEKILAAVRDSGHAQRLNAPVGPLVFVRTGGDNGDCGEYINCLDLLSHADREARTAAIACLGGKHGRCPFLTPLSQALIHEYADRVCSESLNEWIGASLHLEAELRQDFLLSLAAFHQAVATNIRAAQEQFWPHVLRPSVSSLLAIDGDGYPLLNDSNKRDAAFAEMAAESEAFEGVLDKYDRALGHLPLTLEAGPSRMLTEWVDRHGRDGVWEATEAWARRSPSPARRLLAIQVALSKPDIVPKQNVDGFWTLLSGFIDVPRENHRGTLAGAAQTFETSLAKHYFQYLDMQTYSMDGNRIASVAWWAARTVTNTVLAWADGCRDPLDGLCRFRATALEPQVERTHRAWQYSPRSAPASTIRFATLYAQEPRTLAVLLAASSERVLPDLGQATGDCFKIVVAALNRSLATCFPLLELPQSISLWAYDHSIVSAARAWLPRISDSGVNAQLLEMIRAAEELADDTRRAEHIVTLPDAQPFEQLLFAHTFRVAAHLGMDRSKLQETLADATWRNQCFRTIGDASLDTLFDALLELQRQSPIVPAHEFPHWFAEAAEANGLDDERRKLLLLGAVVASANTGTVSAVRRLLRGQWRLQLADEAARLRDAIRQVIRIAPPSVVGSLRDVLSSLVIT